MKHLIILALSIFIISCGGNTETNNKTEPATLTIDFKAVFGDKANDDNTIMENSYLKVTGSLGILMLK